MNISGTPTISLNQEPKVVKIRDCIDLHFPDLQVIEYTNILVNGLEWSVTNQLGTDFASSKTKRDLNDNSKSWILIRQPYTDSLEANIWVQFPWASANGVVRYRKVEDCYSIYELHCLFNRLKKDSMDVFYELLRFTSQEHIKSFPVGF